MCFILVWKLSCALFQLVLSGWEERNWHRAAEGWSWTLIHCSWSLLCTTKSVMGVHKGLRNELNHHVNGDWSAERPSGWFRCEGSVVEVGEESGRPSDPPPTPSPANALSQSFLQLTSCKFTFYQLGVLNQSASVCFFWFWREPGSGEEPWLWSHSSAWQTFLWGSARCMVTQPGTKQTRAWPSEAGGSKTEDGWCCKRSHAEPVPQWLPFTVWAWARHPTSKPCCPHQWTYPVYVVELLQGFSETMNVKQTVSASGHIGCHLWERVSKWTCMFLTFVPLWPL